MVKDHRSPARGDGHSSSDPVIQLETGDFESLDIEEALDIKARIRLDKPAVPVATQVLPDDPQRAVPTHVYDSPDSLDPALPGAGAREDSRPGTGETSSGPGRPVEPAFLHIERGPGEGRHVRVPERELVVGRSSASGLRLSHPSVSREHAVLLRCGSRFFVRDVGSHNGTFVNGRQISGQTEIFSGDEITMGKAVLVLRHGGHSTRSRAGMWAPFTEHRAFKVGIFGSAVALGILSVLIASHLWPERDPQPSRPATTSREGPKTEHNAVTGMEERSESASSSEPSRRGDLSPQRPNEISAARVFEETRHDPGPARLDAPSKIIDVNPKRQPAPPTRKAPPPTSRTATVARVDDANAPEAMAAYESGDLDGAIASARARGKDALANKITTFKKEIALAKADLGFHDGGGAIKHYSAALAIDDELSKGWGKLGGQIRVELSKLYQIAGMQAVEKGDSVQAKALFQKALKYDPENERAKEFLARISGVAAPAKQPDEPRSAADQAFEQ